jgi:hypothetical protein
VSRWLLGATGLALVGYGGWLLLTRGHDLLGVDGLLAWLVAGVLVHDGVLAVLSVALGMLAVRVAPPAGRAPLAVGFVVLAPLTLLAVPVLGRFGARADNPTLLDRPYVAGWLAIAGLAVVVIAVAALVRSRRR